MSEMIERVARAIAGDAWNMAEETHGYEYQGPDRQDYREMARRAITAMRDPTEGMVSEGYCEAGGTEADPAEVWRFMIDEALK